MAGNSQAGSSPWGSIGSAMSNAGFPPITPQNAGSSAVANEIQNNPMAGWMLPLQGLWGMMGGGGGAPPPAAAPQTPQGGQAGGGSPAPAAPAPQPSPFGLWGSFF